jgi:hypothetical protein
MASYTDKTPTFNPYVQQLPVEAMMKVGMYKQQKYDEGVQKIQTSIDNVAGLDVASELDKSYLQSKLNALGNNLKTVAAGDFSDFSLVNSVNGMTKQIVKDENVINAVSSTARIRQEQKILDQADKEGKSSVQNRAKFEEGVSQYINKTDIKQSYRGKYTQYTDIDKKLREVADKIHEVDNSIENPYKRDNAGNTLYFKKDKSGNTITSTDPNSGGVSQIDDAILSVKVKGKPAEKILSNFYSSLNENDKQQLGIDSWYHYRGATADTFKADATNNYNLSKQILTDKIIQKNLELTTNPKLSTADQNKIKAEINDANKKLTNGSLDKELNDQIAEIDSNKDVEQYKYKLYTQKTLTNLAKDMSWQSYEQEYKANPYAQMDMQKKQLQFSYDNASRDQRNQDRAFNWGVTKFYAEQAAAAAKLKGGLATGDIPVTDKAIGTEIDTPTAGGLNEEILSISGERTKGGVVTVPGQIDLLTNKYLDKITDPSLGTSQKKATYLDYLSRSYAQDPSKLIKSLRNPNLAKYLEERRALEITLGQKQSLYNATKAASKVFDDRQDAILKQEAGVNYTNGRAMYTASELYNFGKDAETFYKTTAGGTSPTTGASTSKTTFDANALLNTYKGRKEEALARAYVNRYQGKNLSPTEKVLIDRTQFIKLKFDPTIGKINQEKRNFESDFLAKRMPERQMQVGTVDYANNKADETTINAMIGNKLNEFQTLGQLDVQKWKDFSPDKLKEIRKDPNASYTIEKKYDGSGNLIVTSGDVKQVIPITSTEMSTFSPKVAQSNPWNDIKNQVMSSPSHTTNLIGGTDSSAATNARLSGYNAPSLAHTALAPLVRFDVEGSADNDGGPNDSYILRMYAQNNGIWQTGYIGNEFSSLATVQERMKMIGPGTVSDFLKTYK